VNFTAAFGTALGNDDLSARPAFLDDLDDMRNDFTARFHDHVSPMRNPNALISSMLCSVERLTMTPPT